MGKGNGGDKRRGRERKGDNKRLMVAIVEEARAIVGLIFWPINLAKFVIFEEITHLNEKLNISTKFHL